jgi:hypothetical protein
MDGQSEPFPGVHRCHIERGSWIVVLGPAVLVTLRRVARRAAFDAPSTFSRADSMP